jgi:hypothetical protein
VAWLYKTGTSPHQAGAWLTKAYNAGVGGIAWPEDLVADLFDHAAVVSWAGSYSTCGD